MLGLFLYYSLSALGLGPRFRGTFVSLDSAYSCSDSGGDGFLEGLLVPVRLLSSVHLTIYYVYDNLLITIAGVNASETLPCLRLSGLYFVESIQRLLILAQETLTTEAVLAQFITARNKSINL